MRTYTATGRVRETVTITLEQSEKTATSVTILKGKLVTIVVVLEEEDE